MDIGVLWRRRPRVEDVGERPDYRFSLANQRTFLAWIRTALALDAAGLAALELLPPLTLRGAREALGVVLLGLGTLVAGTSYHRWEANERSLRTNGPLPSSALSQLLGYGLAAVSLAAAMLVLGGGRR